MKTILAKANIKIDDLISDADLQSKLTEKQGKKYISAKHLLDLLATVKANKMLEVTLSPNTPPDPGVK